MKWLAKAAGAYISLILSLVACGPRQARAPVQQDLLYASVPVGVQIKEADVIVAGTITEISGTRWNQDSGEYWEQRVQDDTGDTLYTALPYYTIELRVDLPVVGETRLGETLVVTQVGTGPGDQQAGSADASAGLQVGDQVVIFLRHTEMGWRDGTRPVLGLFSAPEGSCFLRRSDGLYETAQFTEKHERERPVPLEQLVERISQVRGM